MSDLQQFIDACRKANGSPVSLRSVFPGRGKHVTGRRASVKAVFGLENAPKDVIFDRQKGTFSYVGTAALAS